MGSAVDPVAAVNNLRVLVVDDYPDSAEASCLLLSALGHECRAVLTGTGAIVQTGEFRPHVVICDIGLPDITGYDVARALRRTYGNGVYLAALTGWTRPIHRDLALSAGFDQHLLKP